MPLDVKGINQPDPVRARLAERPASVPPRRPEPRLTGEAGVTVEAHLNVAAGSVPVDAERVEEIRKALENGSYPVIPTRIADAMIAARLLLSTSE